VCLGGLAQIAARIIGCSRNSVADAAERVNVRKPAPRA
jgi:hypothetical protein